MPDALKDFTGTTSRVVLLASDLKSMHFQLVVGHVDEAIPIDILG